MLLITIVLCSAGYWFLGFAGHFGWTLPDCIYFTVISILTVGYSETLPGFETHPTARLYNMVVLVVGYAVMLWASSTIIAVFVEGRVSEIIHRRRIMRQISELRDHYVLCGVGETGIHVLEELRLTKRDVVVVERDHDRLEIARRHALDLYVEGDAEDEEVLRAVGIERAAGFVACLSEDKDNIYLVMSARQLNPQLRIIARATHMTSYEKLQRAGADVVISPNYIGGLRMASEMTRPHVTTFLDAMMRDPNQVTRIEEVTIADHSPVDGKSIGHVGVSRKTGLLILATRDRDGHWAFNPGPDHILRDGMALVVLGLIDNVIKLRHLVND